MWELSINTTKQQDEKSNLEKDSIEKDVIDTINNLIKTFPKDPLISSYYSPATTLKTTTTTSPSTSSSTEVPELFTSNKKNLYYNIDISKDPKVTDLSIFQYLKNIVKTPVLIEKAKKY